MTIVKQTERPPAAFPGPPEVIDSIEPPKKIGPVPDYSTVTREQLRKAGVPDPEFHQHAAPRPRRAV